MFLTYIFVFTSLFCDIDRDVNYIYVEQGEWKVWKNPFIFSFRVNCIKLLNQKFIFFTNFKLFKVEKYVSREIRVRNHCIACQIIKIYWHSSRPPSSFSFYSSFISLTHLSIYLSFCLTLIPLWFYTTFYSICVCVTIIITIIIVFVFHSSSSSTSHSRLFFQFNSTEIAFLLFYIFFLHMTSVLW